MPSHKLPLRAGIASLLVAFPEVQAQNTWEMRYLGAGSANDFASNGSLIVSTGLRSVDGRNWTRTNDPLGTTGHLAWFDSLFYEGGEYGKVYVSPDGIAWDWRDVPYSPTKDRAEHYNYQEFRKRGDTVFAIAYTSKWTLDAGRTWNSAPNQGPRYYDCPDLGIQVTLFGADKIYSTGSGSFTGWSTGLALSRDGKTNFDTSATGQFYSCLPIACGAPGMVFAGGDRCGDETALIFSKDGTQIHDAKLPLPSRTIFHDFLWTGSQFVAVGDSGLILTSPDGENWTKVATPAGKHSLRKIFRLDSTLYVGGDSVILASKLEAPLSVRPDRNGSNRDLSLSWNGRVLRATWTGPERFEHAALRDPVGRVLVAARIPGRSGQVEIALPEGLHGIVAFELVGPGGTRSRLVAAP